MDIKTIGIDLAKSVFQLHGVDAEDKVVLKKKLRRGAVLDLLRKPLAAHWDEMWAAVAVMLYTGDLQPRTQADIERAMSGRSIS